MTPSDAALMTSCLRKLRCLARALVSGSSMFSPVDKVKRHHLEQAARAGAADDGGVAARFDLHDRRQQLRVDLVLCRPVD